MLRALLLGSALSLPVSAAVGSFGRDQFAFNLHIELRNDTPLYSASVPNIVYESLTRSDFGDVRVFNARGEQVPHTFRHAPAQCGLSADGDWTTLDSHVDPPPAMAWVKAHPDYASHGVLTN
jgi:hypothetical protein